MLNNLFSSIIYRLKVLLYSFSINLYDESSNSASSYFDAEAVVGCEDGTAHVFDMYSRRCSRIIR